VPSSLWAESIISVLIIVAKVACVLLSSSHSSYNKQAQYWLDVNRAGDRDKLIEEVKIDYTVY